MFQIPKLKPLCLAAAAAVALALTGAPATAQDKGTMHVAFGDIPGPDMVNFLAAVARAEKRGVEVEVSYLQSEDIAAQAVVGGQADIGVGTPYALIQKVKAPIRMFYQLSQLRFYPVVNGETRQDGNTRDLIFSIPVIIETLLLGMTLEPGDIISTGTPSGVGYAMDPPQFLKAGDEVTCQIEGIGTLTNWIADKEAA